MLNRKFQSLILVSVLIVFFVIFCSQTFAAEGTYPERNINVVITYAPGGGSDVLAQAVQPFLEKYLGVSFINMYKPGASGSVGWTYFVNQTKADGYTVSIGTTPSLPCNPIKNPETTMYSMDDIIPIFRVVDDPDILVVNADSPFNTLEDFINYAKENPNMLTVGISGVGGDDWISTKILEKKAGIEVIMVPFTGDGPSWQAALGGHIDASSNNLGIVYPQIVDGSLKPLVLYSEKRSAIYPDVPTATELGYDIVNGSSRGYIVKTGTPPEAIKTLEEAFEKVMVDPEFIAMTKKAGIPVSPLGTEGYTEILNKIAVEFKPIWEEFQTE